jgi:hypothetical protein
MKAAGLHMRFQLTPRRIAAGVIIAVALAVFVTGLRNKDPSWMALGLFVTLFSAILWALTIVIENSDLRADNERLQSRIQALSAAYPLRVAERDRALQRVRDLEAARLSKGEVAAPRPQGVA